MATKLVINCETGENELVPLTAEEIEALEKASAENAAHNAAEAARIQAIKEAQESAIAKLTALGLTENEAKAIIG